MTEANSINAATTGLVINTGTSFTATTVTQHDLLIGGASNAITSVAPSATSGVPVISQGAGADPTFGTAVVAGGGTGATTLTGLLTGNGTSAVTATAITQYNVLTGGASNAPNSVAPSATSGVPVISQGSSSQPIFGTAVVAGGGTGVTSTTAYGVVCGGTTTTGALQNAGAGTATQYLISNGSAALPSWQSPTGGIVQEIRATSSSAVSTTGTWAFGGSPPIKTDGGQLITATITPKSGSNILKFEFNCTYSNSLAGSATIVFALFEGTTTNAVFALNQTIAGGGTANNASFVFYKTSPGTSSTTYAVRYGATAASTTYVNSVTGTQFLGGTETTTFIVTEVLP